MEKLLVLNLGQGNCQAGLPSIVAQLWLDQTKAPMQFTGNLPPLPELAQSLETWSQEYLAIHQHLGWRRSRNTEFEGISFDPVEQPTHISRSEFRHRCQILGQQFNQWLNSEGFQPIQRQIRTQLHPNDAIRIVITVEDLSIIQLPWHLWQFLEDYPQAEIAFGPPAYARSRSDSTVPKSSATRILAILGNSQGIDIAPDRQQLEQLPNATIQFLVEPDQTTLQQQIWEKQWDILFFAGHSSSQQSGEIQINANAVLTIEELKYGLNRAIAKGLRLAIFNSCDGLGLATALAQLRIPQVIVMKQPIPDRVAQTFLTEFLRHFATGRSLYQSVREAREHLQILEADFPCATWLPIICQNPAEPPVQWGNPTIEPVKPIVKKHRWSWRLIASIIAASGLMTGLALGAKSLGWLQSFDLAGYDQIQRLRPIEPIDPRLLIVGITEADIQSPENQPRSGSLADPLLLKLLKVIDQGKPRVIGLDIYRDFPTTLPGLKQSLQTDDRLITICKRPDTKDDPTGIKPAPEAPIDAVGFSDFVQDIDSGIRRHLIAMDPVSTSRCSTGLAFSTLLALQYLSEEDITAEFDQDRLKIGNRRLRSLRRSPGGYLGQEMDGLQLLLNYRRNPQGIAQMVTLQEMLSGQVPDAAIRDRIILIGVVSPNSSDRWATPFGHSFAQKQSGVVVQAQMVSQILSAVQDQRPLIYPVPLTQLLFWSFAWGVLGGFLGGWRSRYRLLLLGGGLVALWVGSGWWLILGNWVPLAMPTITFFGSAIAIAQLNSFKFMPNQSNTGNSL